MHLLTKQFTTVKGFPEIEINLFADFRVVSQNVLTVTYSQKSFFNEKKYASFIFFCDHIKSKSKFFFIHEIFMI